MPSSSHRNGQGQHRNECGSKTPEQGPAAARDAHDCGDLAGELDGEEEADTTDIRALDAHCEPLCGHVMTQPTRMSVSQGPGHASVLSPGTRIGAYRIRQLIGRGGCSTVYAARHGSTDKHVAVKVLHPRLAVSQRQVLRFIHEAQAVQRIRHPNIVEMYESGYLTDGCPYLVMEFIPGRSLADVLQEKGRFSPQEVAGLLAPVCEALAHVHEAGIVHRDIKASNIMLIEGPGQEGIKLLDFGIAKLMNSEQDDALKTSIGRIVGTPHSMAPEQILGQAVDSRTDTYALGALLYRLLTGRHPYLSRDAQLIVQMHLKAPLPKPSAHAPVAPAVDEVVQRAMAKDPEHRYASPRLFLAELRQAIQPARMAANTGVKALAVLVQGRVVDDESNDELCDDELCDDELIQVDLMESLDRATGFLRGRGFQIALHTSDAVLGVMPATERYEQARLAVLRAAGELHDELARRPGRHSRLHINLCVHCDQALVREHGNAGARHGGRIHGGAIMDIGTWAPGSRQPGLCATREVMAARAAETGMRYVRVDLDTIEERNAGEEWQETIDR